jgi:phosphoglucomutase
MSLAIQELPTAAYPDQKPGTSGLRKQTKAFLQQPNYLHNFVQALCDALAALDGSGVRGQTIALGGDGRFYNDTAAQLIINTLAANGAAGVVVGQNALMSTPAVSACIRQRALYGGIILSASHNPAGPEGDVGIKFNTSNGGPALEDLTDRIFNISKSITRVLATSSLPSSIDISSIGCQTFAGSFAVTVVSSTQDYFDVLQTCFDFPLIRQLLSRQNFKLKFDAMNAVTGPYARELFDSILSSGGGSCCVNATPLPDFGGGHPDPNLVYARSLVDSMIADPSICLGAASDGDGDRNMILGSKGFFVCPCDSLAVIALHHHRIPLFASPGSFPGTARSMQP